MHLHKRQKQEEKSAEEQIKLMGDRTFECGKQSLKVGAQGVQLWEGGKLIDSILYQQLHSWQPDDGKKKSGPKKEKNTPLSTEEKAEKLKKIKCFYCEEFGHYKSKCDTVCRVL